MASVGFIQTFTSNVMRDNYVQAYSSQLSNRFLALAIHTINRQSQKPEKIDSKPPLL